MPEPTPGVLMGTRLSVIPGYLVVSYDGQESLLAISSILRAADIPIINFENVPTISTIVNLLATLIRTLIAKGILSQKFLEEGEYDLAAIIESIEDMGGDYSMPDISVP